MADITAQLDAIEKETEELAKPLREKVERNEHLTREREKLVANLMQEIQQLEKANATLNKSVSEDALLEVLLTDEAMKLEQEADELEAKLAQK